MRQKFAVYGLTGSPVHNGHLQSFLWLQEQGFRPLVVPAIGHEFKPEAAMTYIQRRHMCKLVFGNSMVPLEELAIQTCAAPIRAIDTLRAALAWFETLSLPALSEYGIFKPEDMPTPEDLFFAVGEDIKVERWTGVDEIWDDGFSFIRLPEVPGVRSTLIRENIATGRLWDHLVPEAVAAYIRFQGMYGWRYLF